MENEAGEHPAIPETAIFFVPDTVPQFSQHACSELATELAGPSSLGVWPELSKPDLWASYAKEDPLLQGC